METTARALAGLGKDSGPSKGFQSLIRSIGEAKTKHEEDRIIRKEAVFLKEKVGSRDVSPRQMREYLIRLIYCEMLGSECSWGYIHAVKFTQSHNTLDKRIGYLAVSLFLHENHELNMLLVNTLQKDLKSSNMLEVAMALIVICKLIGAEMIPPLLPLVQDKMMHPKELVRKKAIMAMHHFFLLSPGLVSHLEDDFRRVLSDKDPGVMEASLILFHDLVKEDPSSYKDLTTSFTNILSQILNRKLPTEFDYHGVPAPWTQMRLLRIMAILGTDDLKTSELIYGVLKEVLGTAECTSNIGQAITYEVIRTVTAIYPNAPLIEKAAKAIVRFVTATNHNWKYLGITALASLVQVNPRYAAEHQMVVIDCLDDPDETLKRKTLDLLFKMTNPTNVTVIAEKLITYLRQTNDEYIRSDLVAKITQLAERFAPDNLWFIQTMNAVFELGGGLVRREVAHNLMRLIAEGTEDEATDQELRLDAVETYVGLLEKPSLPDVLIKIICWVVGEYAYVLEDTESEEVLEKVTQLLQRRLEETDTHCWVVTAITKLVAQLGHMPESVQSQIAIYLVSTNTDVQERCSELLELSRSLTMMQTVLPLDAACEDLEVDSSLSFLDDFVSESLARGASAYKPPHLRPQPTPKQQPLQPQEIKYKAYALPSRGTVPPISTTASSLLTPTPAIPINAQDKLSTQEVGRGSPSSLKIAVTTLGTTPPLSGSTRPGAASSSLAYTPDEVPTHSIVLKSQDRKWGRTGYTKAPVVSVTTNPESYPFSPPPNQPEAPPPTDQSEGSATSFESERRVDVREPLPTTLDSRTALSHAQASPYNPSPEERKKQELASQLFGGLTGPSRAPRSRQQRRAAEGSSATGSKASPQLTPRGGGGAGGRREKHVETDLLLDLQDIDFSPSAPGSVPPPQPPVQNGLLGFGSAAPAPGGGGPSSSLDPRSPERPLPSSTRNVPATVPTRQPLPATTSAADDLLGLFDGPITTATPQPTTTDTATPPTARNNILAPQVTSDLSLLEPSPASLKPQVKEPQGSLALTLFENPLGSIRVPSEYASHPVAHEWDNKDVCHDANLRVTLTKVLMPDKLVLVLFLANQKQNELSGISLMLDPPSNLKALTSSGTEDLSLQTTIAGFGNVSHVITLVPTAPAINMSLRGQLAYKDPMATQKRLFFDATIQVSDAIRPLVISTEEFGRKWGSLTYERKLKLQSSLKPPELMDALRKKFNLHPIQLIKSEGIAAGNFLPDTMCLVHGKVGGHQLEFWVRTNSSLLTESIAKLAQLVLK